MEPLWPQFVIPQRLDGTRAWTASFDSYDQYREWCYYCIRLFDGTQLVGDIMAQVDPGPENLTEPGAGEQIYAQVARVAASGETNTAWGGVFGRAPEDPFTHFATNPWDAMTTTETSSQNGRWILRDARIPGHVVWQIELVERWTKRVERTWQSWSRRVRSVVWDGDTLVICHHDNREERFVPQ